MNKQVTGRVEHASDAGQFEQGVGRRIDGEIGVEDGEAIVPTVNALATTSQRPVSVLGWLLALAIGASIWAMIIAYLVW